MNPWGNIAIATRLTRIDPSFFISWSGLLLSGIRRRGDIVVTPAVNLPHSCACNVLAERFLNTTCDTMLIVDDDMEFAHDALERLRESGKGYDVLSALFCCGSHPHQPCVLNKRKMGRPVAAKHETIDGVMTVDYVGFGFTLIRRWIIERLAEKNGIDGVFQFKPSSGEDGYFSEQARAICAKLAVNTDVSVGHRVDKTVYFDKTAREIVIGDNSFGVKWE